jgi:hypothetical protein
MPLCEQREHIASDAHPRAAPLFPPSRDARWNPERPAVEFGVEIGKYRGVVRVPRRVRLLPSTFRWKVYPDAPVPGTCILAINCRMRSSSGCFGSLPKSMFGDMIFCSFSMVAGFPSHS